MNKLPIAAKQYFKEVKKHLSCPWGKKKIYIDYIKDQIDQDFLYNENLTIEALTDLLGEPEKVAAGFESADPKEMTLREKKFLFANLFIISLVVIVVLLVILLVILYENWGGYVIISD